MELDAMLGHVASWGDRIPHETSHNLPADRVKSRSVRGRQLPPTSFSRSPEWLSDFSLDLGSRSSDIAEKMIVELRQRSPLTTAIEPTTKAHEGPMERLARYLARAG